MILYLNVRDKDVVIKNVTAVANYNNEAALPSPPPPSHPSPYSPPPASPLSNNFLVGDWKIAPIAKAVGIGPNLDDPTQWWSNNAPDIVTRACFFDDIYRFGEDMSFRNVMGTYR